MRCQDMLPLIEKLADGECTPTEKARAEAHLETCESCRAHFQFLEALAETARKVPLPEPPEMYWEVLPRKVMARIDQARSASASPGWLAAWLPLARLRWLGALAAAVIAVVVGLEVWTFRQLKEPVEQPLASTVADDLGAEEEEPARAARMAREPSLEEAPIVPVPTEDRPAAPESAQAARLAGVAGERDEEQETTLAFQAVSISPSADRQEQVEGIVSKTQAAAVSQDEAAVGVSEDKEVAVGGAASPPPATPAPAEVPVLQEELSSERRVDASDMRAKESYLMPGEPPRKRRQATYQTLSIQKSSEELRAECQTLKTFLAQNPDTEKALDARYRLALCSIRLFKSNPTEDTRRQAVEDCSAFLEVSSEGERADEIRKALEPIK